jgi:hypothetical protein
MASVNVPRISGWGNPYSSLLGALGPSLCHGGGLGAPFLFGRRVAGIAGIWRKQVMLQRLRETTALASLLSLLALPVTG